MTSIPAVLLRRDRRGSIEILCSRWGGSELFPLPAQKVKPRRPSIGFAASIGYWLRCANANSCRSMPRTTFLATLSSSRFTNSAAKSSSNAPRYLS